MVFSEQLLRLRKSRGLSQEELAECLGVSRQAVSKWETGESVPDLPKLLALSEALETSLDVLCGRESAPAAGSETQTAEPQPAAEKKRRRVFPAVLAALALTLAFFAGWALSSAQPGTGEPVALLLPETLTVSGVNFSIDSAAKQLRYRCIPSASAEGLTWEVSFTDLYTGNTHVQEAEWEGGVCTGLYPCDAGEFLVTLTVSNGQESRSVPLAEYVSAAPRQNYVSWRPAED
ncbi:MAG: helix-turn-helix transcriptional regulator [Oscillospiraceae bacterium]